MRNINFIKLSIFLVILFFSKELESQWISKTGVTSYNITDIKFINNSTGFLCTAYEPWPGTVNGQLIKTTNNGTTWNTIFTDYHKKFAKIFFINENTGFARLLPYVNYSYRNNICRTSNGGLNWDTIYYNSPINDLFFINTSTGWGVGSTYSTGIYSAKILKTTNGGNFWTIITPGGFNLTSVQFSDSLIGFASGTIINVYTSIYKDIIMKTTNGGIDWLVKDSSYNIQVTSQCFINTNTGYISGANGNILKTTNGGENWQALSTGFTSSINSISFINSERGWCISNSGAMQYIFYTFNSGHNWFAQYTYSTSAVLNVIYMSVLNSGWSGGSSGYLLYTNNGGSTNEKIISYSIPNKYYLYQNYPNPFNSTTNIRFNIKESGFVIIKIYDIYGKEVSNLISKNMNPGIYEIRYNNDKIANGVYFCKMITKTFSEIRKMIIIK